MAKKYICSTCGTVGSSVTKTPGSLVVEIFLWLIMIIPGAIYTLWRLMGRKKVCTSCGNPTIIPADTPGGKAIAQRFNVTLNQA